MPDHVHVLLTTKTSLEKAARFIKGGFSYRAKKELGSNMEVWQKGFSDHRIRDAEDYTRHVSYIRENPLRKHLCQQVEPFAYSSAHGGFELDPAPQGLKPALPEERETARLEGVPFQSKTLGGAVEAASFPTKPNSSAEASTFQHTMSARDEDWPPSRPIAGDKGISTGNKDKIA